MSCDTSATTREFIRLSCMSGCGVPSAVRLLLRAFQLSPTRPFDEIELSFLENFALADPRPAHDHLEHAAVLSATAGS